MSYLGGMTSQSYNDFGHGFWCTQVAGISGRDPGLQHEIQAQLALLSTGCAPQTLFQQVVKANNCYARGRPAPDLSEAMARAYGELRNGARLPLNSKQEAFANALGLHASRYGQEEP